jgi:hypothetical protein
MVPELRGRMATHPRAKVTVSEEHDVEGHRVDGVTDPWVAEQMTESEALGPTASRSIGGSVDRVAFVIVCSGLRQAWPWEEVTEIASAQAAKLRTAVGETNDT